VTSTQVPQDAGRESWHDVGRAAQPQNSIWLSHHWSDDEGRCAHIGGRLVCRRCLVLYPVALVAAVAAAAGLRWPTSLDVVLLWLLPLPAVLDFVADNLAVVRHSPRRQVVVTALLGVSLGVASSRYLHHAGDSLVWSVVATYGLICLVAALARVRRPAPPA
jgi:hypothetical protein